MKRAGRHGTSVSTFLFMTSTLLLSMPNCLSLIAAIGKERELGFQGELLWHIPDDMMKRFKKLTTGHPVIMGRKTWESLPEKSRPLPKRTNIVITRQPSYKAEGALVVESLSDAFLAAQDAEGSEETFVVGGGEIYAQTLPYATRLYLTCIDATSNADIFFPPYEKEFTKVVSDESREWDGLQYRWITLEK